MVSFFLSPFLLSVCLKLWLGSNRVWQCFFCVDRNMEILEPKLLCLLTWNCMHSLNTAVRWYFHVKWISCSYLLYNLNKHVICLLDLQVWIQVYRLFWVSYIILTVMLIFTKKEFWLYIRSMQLKRENRVPVVSN